MKICAEVDCNKNSYCRGLCRNHYTTQYRNGTYAKVQNKCAVGFCNNIARGTKGKTILCNGCYVKLCLYKIDINELISLPNFCEICGGTYRLSVDHNHENKKVRGVLCSHCNPALGMMKEDISNLFNMIDYINKYS